MREDERLLFRVKEVAEKLGIGRTTTYKLIRSGRLKLVKIGNASRITRESAERVAAEGAE